MIRSQPLRILMITPWYGVAEGGGVAIAIENLVHGLQRCGARIFVIKIVGDGWYPHFSRGAQNELIVRLPLRGRHECRGVKGVIGYWLRLPIADMTLLILGIVTRFQFVNFHYYAPPYEHLRKILRFLHYRFIASFQGSDIMVAPDCDGTREALGYLVREAEKVVGVSGTLINELTRLFPEAATKCSVIHNTVDIDFIRSVSNAAPASELDIDVLFVGGLIPVKGPDLLVDAFHKVVQKRPGALLCLVGTGYMEEELRDTIRDRGIEANVKFAGFVPHQELVNYYGRTKLIVMPSRSEGFPHVAMEAAICGKPVVAFNVGGLAELVEDGSTGILVPPTDSDALANAMLELLESPSLAQRMGDQGRRRGMQAFDPSHMVQSYMTLYDAIIARN